MTYVGQASSGIGAAPPAPRADPRRRRLPPAVWVSPTVVGVLILVWHLVTAAGWLSPRTFSQPTDVAGVGRQALVSRRLWSDASSTFVSLAIGVSLALVAGVIVGLVLGRVERVRWMFEWQLLILNSLPRITLAPLILVTVGLGTPAKAWVAFLSCAVPVALLVSVAAREIPNQLLAVSRAFGLGRRAVLTKTVIPAVVPNMFAGLQLGATRGLLAVVVTEMFNPRVGLGRWITVGMNSVDPAQMFFAAFLVAAGGAALVQLLALAERLVVRWR